MIAFWTEEEYQKEIEEVETQAQVEILAKVIKTLEDKQQHLLFLDKDEQAEGVQKAIDTIALIKVSLIKPKGI